MIFDEEAEIAPGVTFKGSKDGYKLCLTDSDEEIISWEYEEVRHNPAAWYNSLLAVATAIKFGPSAAKNSAKSMKNEIKPPGGSLCCNVCGKKFIVEPGHPHVFSAKLNDHYYLEFQCSSACNDIRKKTIYENELGDDFMNLWKNKVCKTRTCKEA